MPHTYCVCHVHLVFSTKERRALIPEDVRERLWAYLGGIARKNDFRAMAVGGTGDHVHVLLSLPATVSIAKAAQLLKGGSSKWVHDSFTTMRHFGWQKGYGAFSIGRSRLGETISYIECQEERHQTRTFEQEFEDFLTRHGIEFDRRHVFG